MTAHCDWHEVLEALRNEFSFRVFGLPLDSPGLLDACEMHERSVFSDERTASFAAFAFAQTAPGSLPIFCVETGPSFMNALLGIVEGQSARLPALVVIDAVEDARRPYGAFQDLPLEDLSTSLGLAIHVVTTSEHLKEHFLSASRTALDSSQPVALILRLGSGSDLENTVRGRRTWGAAPSAAESHRYRTLPSEKVIDLLRARQEDGARITVVVGGGARQTALRSDDLVSFATSLNAELLVTASARGLVDESHPNFAGLAGLYSTPRGHRASTEADCIVLLGTALEETARERWAPKPGAQLIVVNTSPPPFPMHNGERVDVLEDMTRVVASPLFTPLTEYRGSWLSSDFAVESDKPGSIWNTLTTVVNWPKYSTICIENGLHDIWAYDVRHLRIARSLSVVSCAEQSAMGVAVCGALGVDASGRVLVVCGDSTLRMHLSAVSDAVERGAPITYIVLRDGGMGWPALSRVDKAITQFPWNHRLGQVLDAMGVAVIDPEELSALGQTPGPDAVLLDVAMQSPPWESS